ncbi:MAG: MOSC N-terminal beta barrel domain-containing protein [Balneolaceae bacterium]|nr:MOSC N-terminal beta barrel domain-containing protein [Balneolaceae bacterium]
MPVVTQLVIYPVKSMHGISVREAELTPPGLKYDRNWMVTDDSGLFITQRDLPSLAAINANLSSDELKLKHSQGDAFHISLQSANRKEVAVEVWGDQCRAFDEGDDAAKWLTEKTGGFKGKKLRLLNFDNRFRRIVDSSYLKGEDSHTAFADGFPYLITSDYSLNRLNERLIESGSEPVPMSRFRPNIVVTGLEAFLENRIEEIYSEQGGYRLGLRKPCKRCKVTTVDQNTGIIHETREPLRTLTLMNTVPGLRGAYFGQNASLLSQDGGIIRLGDQFDFTLKPDD